MSKPINPSNNLKEQVAEILGKYLIIVNDDGTYQEVKESAAITDRLLSLIIDSISESPEMQDEDTSHPMSLELPETYTLNITRNQLRDKLRAMLKGMK